MSCLSNVFSSPGLLKTGSLTGRNILKSYYARTDEALTLISHALRASCVWARSDVGTASGTSLIVPSALSSLTYGYRSTGFKYVYVYSSFYYADWDSRGGQVHFLRISSCPRLDSACLWATKTAHVRCIVLPSRTSPSSIRPASIHFLSPFVTALARRIVACSYSEQV